MSADTAGMFSTPSSAATAPDLLSTQEFEIDRYQHYARFSMLLAIGVHAVFAIAGLLIGALPLTALQLVSILVYGVSLLIHKRRVVWLLTLLAYVDLLGHSTLAGWMVGREAGFQYYSWILLPLLFTNVNRSLRSKFVIAGILTVSFMSIDWWLGHLEPLLAIESEALASLRYFNIGCFLLALGVASYAHSATIREAEERLRSAAGTDDLTGLMNRRRMSERLVEEVARVRRSGAALSVLLLDIDRFKSINDEHGHAQGDRVIEKVADVLRAGVRQVDMVSRWGGEEFLILLPDTDVQAAAELAERIRRQVTARVRRHEISETRVTVTSGIAMLRPRESIEAAIHRADLALYEGKRSGRDRVVVAEGDVDVDLRGVAQR
jgi:diguanylate cyclase (GGDEF)-like protein